MESGRSGNGAGLLLLPYMGTRGSRPKTQLLFTCFFSDGTSPPLFHFSVLSTFSLISQAGPLSFPPTTPFNHLCFPPSALFLSCPDCMGKKRKSGISG